MAKYVSRFALGLSSSIPGLRMESDSMKFIDDIGRLDFSVFAVF